MKFKVVLLSCFYFFSSMSHAVEEPSGLRPCCAFGINMKSKLGAMPVPFFKVKNIVQISDLKKHHYNDGTQGVLASLVGKADESNGLIYTSKGGIIDTAHVRDTGDNTLYIFNQIRGHLGTNLQFILDAELRYRIITLHQAEIDLTAQQKEITEINLSGLLAFRLAQWHEIAQWFGYTSVVGFKEYPSAFSPEDLYSNMLGALIAIEILQENPDLTVEQYQLQFNDHFIQHLTKLGAHKSLRTEVVMSVLDGRWWDSHKRLPDKWVVKTRDYTPRLTITPHWGDGDREKRTTISLEQFAHLEQWGDATFTAINKESHFKELSESLRKRLVWKPKDFAEIAEFAKQVDDKHPLNTNNLINSQ